MYACSDIEGNLVGVSGRDTWYPDVLGPGKVPLGMVYVPSGAYQAGEDDEDIMGFHTARKRTVSVPAFYMDATEISNNEYRQFVHWVRDSIAREKLYRRSYDEEAERWVNIPDNFFKEPYRTLMAMGSDVQGGNTPFQLFMDSTNSTEVDKTIMTMLGNYDKSKGKGKKLVNGFQYDQKKYGVTGGPDEKFDVIMSDDDLRGIFQMYSGSAKKNSPDKTSAKGASTKTKYNQGGRLENRKYFTLNWMEPIDYEDPEIAFMLSDMYLSEAERFYNRREIDTRLLYFDYYWIDYKEAARRGKVITKSIDARKTFSYDSLNGEAANNIYRRDRREPLGKDYKSNDQHRSTLYTVDQNTNKVWVDTTLYVDQWAEGVTKINDTNSLKGSILANPGQDLDLGFTDSKGADDYNLNLSNQRATAVKNYLAAKGLVSSRFTVVGMGEAEPIATNDTEEGRSQNRRVEFAIVANDKMIEDAKKEAGK